MDYCFVPGTGLKVSKVCVGTMMFGQKILDQAEADRVVSSAIDNGINFFDTADQYADGVCETMLGKALGEKRKDVVIASKVGFPCIDKKEFSLSRQSIKLGIDGTLKRLNTDYLDIYYLHQPDYNTPLEETLDALNDEVHKGKVNYVGMSNYAAWQIMDAISICEKHGWARPVITENCYNMITRGLESELVPFMREKKVGLVNFNPLAGGLLTGKYTREAPHEGSRFYNNKNYLTRYWHDDNFDVIEKINQLANQNDMNILELAYSWCLSQKHITSVLVGFANEKQFATNIAALGRGPLSKDILDECDVLWKQISGGRVQYNR